MPLGTKHITPWPARTHHIQAVFAVHRRQSLIEKEWETNLYKYITGIIQNHGHKLLQINGMPDYIHLVFGLRPTQSLSDLMKQVKQDSSKWVNEQGFLKGKFSWQAGFGAFSYSKSDIPRVIQYVKNQKEHHQTKSFNQEYVELLKSFDVEYEDRYIFKTIL